MFIESLQFFGLNWKKMDINPHKSLTYREHTNIKFIGPMALFISYGLAASSLAGSMEICQWYRCLCSYFRFQLNVREFSHWMKRTKMHFNDLLFKRYDCKRYDYSLVNPWKDNDIPPETYIGGLIEINCFVNQVFFIFTSGNLLVI